MPIVTFIYRIRNRPRTYYGKYVTDSMSDDHDGLDAEIKPHLLRGINLHRIQSGKSIFASRDIKIGVLYCSGYNPFLDWSTEEEVLCFDFYCKEQRQVCTYYLNGREMINNQEDA